MLRFESLPGPNYTPSWAFVFRLLGALYQLDALWMGSLGIHLQGLDSTRIPKSDSSLEHLRRLTEASSDVIERGTRNEVFQYIILILSFLVS